MAAEDQADASVQRQRARRLFFALWADEAMRQAMAQATRKAASASGGHPVPAENLHVTLAFLGPVPERRLARLGEIARATAGAPGSASAGSAGSPLEAPSSSLSITSSTGGRRTSLALCRRSRVRW